MSAPAEDLTDLSILLNEMQAKPVLGQFMKARRTAVRMSQADVAAQLFVSTPAYSGYETGRRTPDAATLARWCDAVQIPDYLLRKLLSFTAAGMYRLDVGQWPPTVDIDDLDHLEYFSVPAFFHGMPECNVLAANKTALRWFPWLAPAEVGSDRPTNIIEQMMTDPRAQESIGNLDEIVHRMIFSLRVMAPGVVSESRVREIIETCSVNPKFARFWTTDMTREEMTRDLVTLKDPDTGIWGPHTMRCYQSMYPDRPYELYIMTPRRKHASDTGGFTDGRPIPW